MHHRTHPPKKTKDQPQKLRNPGKIKWNWNSAETETETGAPRQTTSNQTHKCANAARGKDSNPNPKIQNPVPTMKSSCGGPQTTQLTTPKTQPRSPKQNPLEPEINETQQHHKRKEHSPYLKEEGAVEEELE